MKTKKFRSRTTVSSSFFSQTFGAGWKNASKSLERTDKNSLYQNWVRFFALLFLSGLATAGLSTNLLAGASASQWVVVVNGDSISSRTVANHFCSLRNIPGQNVIVLEEVPDTDRITVDQFRELILKPVLEQVQKRRLANHIQGIVYSSDFPTSVDLNSDLEGLKERPKVLTPVGSINGLTYLYRHVLTMSPAYIGLEANGYSSRPGTSLLKPLLTSDAAMKQVSGLVQEEKWQESAEFLEQEMVKLPLSIRTPLLVIAAQLWMKANAQDNAIAHLEDAVRQGWQYRTALQEDPLFQPILQETPMVRLLAEIDDAPFDYTPFRGFDARNRYAPNSYVTDDSKFGASYLLSMVLGVTRDFGITRFEVVESLKRSAAADYQSIEGAFLFTKTDDVRTATRAPHFKATVERLRLKGYQARVVQEAVPKKNEKCAGLMIGTPSFALSHSGAQLMPGSIADNLTSFGGAMTTSGQSKATEFIRHGAAASSGAVYEPYAIINKFPHPMIHDAYTDGLTVAEAFYGTLLCPYQMLIIGDPLCQPFAKPPRFTLRSSGDPATQNSGVTVFVDQEEGAPEIVSLAMTLDGAFVADIPFRNSLHLDLGVVNAGWHELRVIATGAKPIENRFEQSHWIFVRGNLPGIGNVRRGSPEIEWSCQEKISLNRNTKASFTVQGFDDSQPLELWHNAELVATLPARTDSFQVDRKLLGNGPVRLQLRQRNVDGDAIFSKICTLEIDQ